MQEITRKLEPRKSSINERSNGLFNDNSRRTAANQPRRQNADASRGNAPGYGSQQAAIKESINRWLNLVKKFRGVIVDLKLVNSGYYLSVMEDRLKAIAEFKGDDRKTRKLAEELLTPEDAVAAALNSSNKRLVLSMTYSEGRIITFSIHQGGKSYFTLFFTSYR